MRAWFERRRPCFALSTTVATLRPARRASWTVRLAEVAEPEERKKQEVSLRANQTQWRGLGTILTSPDGEPVAGPGAVVLCDAAQGFCAHVLWNRLWIDALHDLQQVWPVQHVGEVDAHADAEGKRGGDEGDSQRRALLVR